MLISFVAIEYHFQIGVFQESLKSLASNQWEMGTK